MHYCKNVLYFLLVTYYVTETMQINAFEFHIKVIMLTCNINNLTYFLPR